MTMTPNDGIGYGRIHLYKNSRGTPKRIHRLVAEAFIPNPENKKDVNHKNGIKCDNRVENLEWVTQSENEIHASTILGNSMKGKTYPKKIKCEDLNIIFNSMSDCIRFLNTGCIEGLKKAIKANRKYHNHTFSYY